MRKSSLSEKQPQVVYRNTIRQLCQFEVDKVIQEKLPSLEALGRDSIVEVLFALEKKII